MQQEKIAILQYLQKQGGSLVVRNPIELGLTAKAFVVAVGLFVAMAWSNKMG